MEPFLRAAEKATHPEDRPDLRGTWQGQIACLRAFIADVHNDVPRTIEMAHLALACLRPDDTATRAFAKYMLGRGHYIRGDLPEAAATLTENVQACMAANLTGVIALSLSMLAMVHQAAGKLRESLDVLADGRAYVERCDPRRVTLGGLAFVGQAVVLHEWNDLDKAERTIRRSLNCANPGPARARTSRCQMVLARILLSQGKLPAAEEALRSAEEAIRGRSAVPEVICDLNAVRVSYWLATQQLSNASQWAQEWERSADPGTAFSIPKERNEITLTRVRIAEGSLDVGLQTLGRLAAAAVSAGRTGPLIEVRILQSLALHNQGDEAGALEMLNESLALARLEGYVQAYVDEGEPMREMLRACALSAPSNNRLHAQTVLAAFAALDLDVASTVRASSPIEPLTARELEILQAIEEAVLQPPDRGEAHSG